MPTYTYRREDGTTFEVRQKFSDDPLEVDPETGQPVERIINNAAGVIFKGSGFYVTDNRSASRPAANGKNGNDTASENGASANGTSDSPKAETKSETKTKTTEKSSDA